jgi:DHA2 family multidrug resistance protein-like MFS transporter
MAARVLLGLAGAGVIVMAISSLTVLFSKEERPKAVGILGAGNFLAMPIGPILGGWLLTNYRDLTCPASQLRWPAWWR